MLKRHAEYWLKILFLVLAASLLRGLMCTGPHDTGLNDKVLQKWSEIYVNLLCSIASINAPSTALGHLCTVRVCDLHIACKTSLDRHLSNQAKAVTRKISYNLMVEFLNLKKLRSLCSHCNYDLFIIFYGLILWHHCDDSSQWHCDDFLWKTDSSVMIVQYLIFHCVKFSVSKQQGGIKCIA